MPEGREVHEVVVHHEPRPDHLEPSQPDGLAHADPRERGHSRSGHVPQDGRGGIRGWEGEVIPGISTASSA